MTEGDYVRTDDGLIGKIVSEPYEYKDSIGHDIDFGDNNIYNEYEMYQDIIKSSPNIIDLIEEEDIITYEYETSIGTIIEYNVTVLLSLLNELEENPNKYKIKSIVTKEQFSCMEYKIGE